MTVLGTLVFLLRAIDGALSKCKSVTEIENKLNQVVKFVSDQGAKYTSKSFIGFCDLYA